MIKSIGAKYTLVGHSDNRSEGDTNEILKNKVNDLPGITHVDGTGRLQTVTKSNNNKFYSLNDAINCCIASSHIPYITTRTATYSYRNKACFDGGFFNSPYSEGVIPNLVVYPEIWNNTKIDNYSRLKNLNIKKLIYAGYEDTYKNRLFIEESLKINKCDESDWKAGFVQGAASPCIKREKVKI